MIWKRLLLACGLAGFSTGIYAQANVASPAVIIYKTKKDYRDHVPVILSEDRSRIISYPDPLDLRSDNGFPLPATLHKGYLLDNRGINQQVAFLSMTYAEYAALQKAPPLSQMYQMIIDKDPLKCMCACGNRNDYQDVQAELTELIRKRKAFRKRCKSIL